MKKLLYTFYAMLRKDINKKSTDNFSKMKSVDNYIVYMCYYVNTFIII